MITTPEKEKKNTGFYNNDNEMSGFEASHLTISVRFWIFFFTFCKFKKVEVYFLGFTKSKYLNFTTCVLKYNRNLNTIHKQFS